MANVHGLAAERLFRAQGHILEALASGVVLTGTTDEIGPRFSLSPDELQICLRELVRAGWAALDVDPAGILTARLERRAGGPPQSVDLERRRGDACWRP
jgi:hypothetical protein